MSRPERASIYSVENYLVRQCGVWPKKAAELVLSHKELIVEKQNEASSAYYASDLLLKKVAALRGVDANKHLANGKQDVSVHHR